MSVLTVASPSIASTPDVVSSAPGSVRVHERVIDKVVREASAVAIGVSRDDVSVEAAEWGGGLAVRIAAKLPVPDLSDLEAIEAAVPVLERVRALQAELAEEFARLTGRDIRRVSFTVTGAVIPKRSRVR